MIDVGKMIATIRKDRNITQQMLADMIGTTKQTISNYERGTRTPDYITLEAIADVLNVPIAMLISREEQHKALNEIYNGYSIKSDPSEAQQDIFDDPDRKALLNLAKYGSSDEVRQIAAIYKAVRDTNPDFYDGDDPA